MVEGVSGLESGLWIWVLCPLSGGFGAVKAGAVDLVLRALGGVWSACGVSWGLVRSLWGSCGRVLKSAADGRRCRYYLKSAADGRRRRYYLPAACCLLPAACCLTYDFS